MSLNRRALLLILPVALLCSLTLVSLGYKVQREAVIGLERSRLNHDLGALVTAYHEYAHFSRSLLYALSNSPTLGAFLRQLDVPYRKEAMGTQIQQTVTQLVGSDVPSRISFAIARPDRSLAYYYEYSDDPFAQLNPAQRRLLEHPANNSESLAEHHDDLIEEDGQALLVANTAILPSTGAARMPSQRDQAMTLQLAVRPDRMENLRHRLELAYGAPLTITSTPPPMPTGLAAMEQLSPRHYVQLIPDPRLLEDRLTQLATLYFGGGLAVTLICFLILVVLIRRYITEPVARLDRQLTEVLDGERQSLETPQEPGEIGHLGGNMKRLHDNNLTILTQLRNALRTDPLTQIGNRRHFQLTGEQWLAEDADPTTIALLCFGLDHFKSVNDRFGHAAGDALLRALAQRTQGLIDTQPEFGGAVFTRLAGDEFAILMRGERAGLHALQLGEQLQRAHHHGTLLGERRYAVSLSLGLTALEDPPNLAELLAQANLAMDEAKAKGGNQLVRFTPQLAAQQRRLDLLDEQLRQLDPDSEFHLEYMPAVDAQGRVRSVEALVRWTSPTLGKVSPAEFIPIAERQGQFRWIDRWVIDRAFQDYPELAEALGVQPILSINLSSAQLDQADIVPYLKERARYHRVDPTQIELEFTETFAAELNECTLTLLQELRSAGFRVAIDDFGVGYTSIQQVTDYPADTIKFDRLIVERLGHPGNQASLDALVAFCHARDAQVIAEGVDTLLKQQCLEQAGCDLLQGFLICPPRRLHELHEWQRQRQGLSSRA